MSKDNSMKQLRYTMLRGVGRWVVPVLLAVVCSVVMVGNLQAAPFAYIPNYYDGTVSVIDTASNTVTATVPAPVTGGNPGYVAVHPNGTRVYITYQHTNLSILDTTTNTFIATLDLGGPNVAGVAVSPDGTRVYAVANHPVGPAGTIAVIDTTTNTEILPRVTVGVGPNGVAVSPDGTRVYVANQYSGTVSVIDAITRTVITTVTVGTMPLGVAVNSAGTLVYVANRDSDTVSVIDTATNTVAATVNVAAGGGDGPIGIAINQAGTRAYVTNIGNSTFSTIDTTTNTVMSTIPVGGTWPGGVDLNSAGTLAYVANTATDNVSIIDTGTNTVVSTVPVGNGPIALGQFIAKDTTPPPPSIDELLSDLLAYVTGIGPGKSLAAKVMAAQAALADGDTTGACDSLQALINEATAQSGKKLTVEQANHIIDAATDIRTQIGC